MRGSFPILPVNLESEHRGTVIPLLCDTSKTCMYHYHCDVMAKVGVLCGEY